MKTTSYEISKKLKKNGLSEKLGFLEYYYNTDKRLRHRDQESYCSTHKENTQVDCFAYDLETILDVLPKQHDFFTRGDGKYELRIWYHENKMFIAYQNFDGFDKLLTLAQEKNESLADIAARLLILLHKKGLINFKEVK
jgi:hypothetical protein